MPKIKEVKYPFSTLEEAKKTLMEISTKVPGGERALIRKQIWDKYPTLRPFQGGI